MEQLNNTPGSQWITARSYSHLMDISGPDSDCIHHHILIASLIQRLPGYKWPAHGLFLLMHIMSWSCYKWQSRRNEHGQYRQYSLFYPWNKQWQPKGKPKNITALTTWPSEWVSMHKCPCMMAMTTLWSESLWRVYHWRAVLPMTVKATLKQLRLTGRQTLITWSTTKVSFNTKITCLHLGTTVTIMV